jgi:pyruvyl transferase EpsO
MDRQTDQVASAMLIDRLAHEYAATLDRLLPEGSDVVLLDYPSHRNIGDHLIWLGQTTYLATRPDISVHYISDRFGYSHGALARALPRDGVVLLCGGGSYGDIYPQVQRMRDAVMEHFPSHRFIQLPQTVSFAGEEATKATAATLERHPDFTLLARDRTSLEFVQAELPCSVELCVDAAFMLGAQLRRTEAGAILWLSRRDGESINSAHESADGVEIADWIDLEHDPRAWTFGYRRARVMAATLATLQSHGLPLGPVRSRLLHAFDRSSWTLANAGLNWMSRGEAVITDRLHGHIMALLLGIPHVLLDNDRSKVRNFYETWTRSAPSVRWADTPQQALDQARTFVQRKVPA